MKFVGVCLVTKNVPLLADFYTRLLGVKAEGDETHVELKTDGAGIAILSAQEMENLAPHSMQGAGYGGLTLMFEVKDVDAEYERLKTLQVEFVKLPTTYPWGNRAVWFRDPDGNIVDFYAVLNK